MIGVSSSITFARGTGTAHNQQRRGGGRECYDSHRYFLNPVSSYVDERFLAGHNARVTDAPGVIGAK